MERKEYTCIVCPKSCVGTLTVHDDGRMETEGFSCKNGEKYAINEYKIDPSDPFAGMFERAGKQDGYIVNYTKKICYALDVTRILSADGTVCDWVDPVSLLLCFGGTGGEGAGLGDRIGVEDDVPSRFVLLEELKLDR